LGAFEHDPHFLWEGSSTTEGYQPREPPAAVTSVVDTAIDLFSQLLPLQDLSSVSRVIDQLLDSVRSSKLDKNIGRRGAVLINAAVALALAFRFATAHHFRQCRETLGSTQVTSVLSPFLMVSLVSGCRNSF
jgi:HEAT repeat-containing protein 5